MKLLEWLRAVREYFEVLSSPEVTWDHKPIEPKENPEPAQKITPTVYEMTHR
jgi:hypothetical protein